MAYGNTGWLEFNSFVNQDITGAGDYWETIGTNPKDDDGSYASPTGANTNKNTYTEC